MGTLGGFPIPAVAQPFDRRKNAGHHAKRDEGDHGPSEIAGFDHVHDGRAEPDGKKAQNEKASGTAGGDKQKQLAARVAERDVGHDDRHKRERRWGEAGQRYRETAALADLFLKLIETIAPGDFLDALLAKLAGYQIEQEDAGGRAANRAQYVKQVSLMVVGDQADYQQIVAERKDQKRRIHHAQNEGAEIVQADEQVKERVEERRQGMIVLARPCSAP